MTYEEGLEKIHSLLTFGSRPGLDRMRLFLERLSNPQDKLKFVHVAGTNGKGSVCRMISSVLVTAGFKTGLFISPYIIDFRERIQINNEMISEEALTRAVEETYPALEQLRSEGVIITEFEYVNALEFYIHANAGCDIVVLETGMGGLLDCTNVIKPPLCSVITTIGLDHTAVLGDTIEQIAKQKCGIIKPYSYTVSSAQDECAMKVIVDTARKQSNMLITTNNLSSEIIAQSLYGSEFKFNGGSYKIRLAGAHQVENAKTALAAIGVLRKHQGFSISDEQLVRGMYLADNPARLEPFGVNPVVMLDGAHNPNGIEALRNALGQFLGGKKIHCVMGMLADKDIDSSVKLLRGMFEAVYTVSVSNPRTISSTELAAKLRRVCADVTSFDSPFAAFDAAYSRAAGSRDTAVVVCGSLYLAAELRPYIQSKVNI